MTVNLIGHQDAVVGVGEAARRLSNLLISTGFRVNHHSFKSLEETRAKESESLRFTEQSVFVLRKRGSNCLGLSFFS
jgi:hypothetical protein